jgi:hypothetical protein
MPPGRGRPFDTSAAIKPAPPSALLPHSPAWVCRLGGLWGGVQGVVVAESLRLAMSCGGGLMTSCRFIDAVWVLSPPEPRRRGWRIEDGKTPRRYRRVARKMRL